MIGPRRIAALGAWVGALVAVGCSRTPPPSGEPATAAKSEASQDAPAAASAEGAAPPGTASCTAPGGPACLRFATPEDAFRSVLAKAPVVLGVGEAHAQRGTEGIASATRRFTESFLPLLAPRASDVVVELWAPDPRCMKEVKEVARAQKPVTEAQATTNQDEFVTLGTKAKEAGMTPWLLRPTCDDFAALADAGEDAVSAMLALVKRLTLAKVAELHERSRAAADPKLVVAYGGALHNDLAPPEATRDYSFGPELDRLTGGRYVELDLIVPELVKRTPTWEKLPWFSSFEAERASGRPLDRPMLYQIGDQSFVLVFAAGSHGPAPRPAVPVERARDGAARP